MNRIQSKLIYLTSLVLFSLNGCESKELSFSERVQQYESNRTQISSTYNINLEASKKFFDEYSKDGTLDVEEQKTLLSYWQNAKQAKQDYDKNIKRNAIESVESLEWNDEYESHLRLLNKNLNEIDSSPPEYQDYLGDKGYNVKVDSCFSGEEMDAVLDVVEGVLGAFSS